MDWKTVRALRNVLKEHLDQAAGGHHLEPIREPYVPADEQEAELLKRGEEIIAANRKPRPERQVLPVWRDTTAAAIKNLGAQLGLKMHGYEFDDFALADESPEHRKRSTLVEEATRLVDAATKLLDAYDSAKG